MNAAAAAMHAAFDRLPPRVQALARPKARRARAELERRRRPRWGNLRRTRPFSNRYGNDRGTPIDRAYLADFCAAHASAITGRVLEVRDNRYTTAFGRGVTALDLVDIDPDNLDATIVADLTEAGSLLPASHDCVLLPQTLQYVEDVDAAIANAWHATRPGGTLLVSVPSITRRDPKVPDGDRWRMLPLGLRTLLERDCPDGEIEVRAYGNLLASIAFLLGLAAEELDHDELWAFDPEFAILACGAVTRPREDA